LLSSVPRGPNQALEHFLAFFRALEELVDSVFAEKIAGA
jgi:hypothetical protein